jgi:inorganic pyrophosphatase
MPSSQYRKLLELLNLRYKPHPWHGISPGERAPEVVTAFIEVVPSDTIKYEVDKPSGFLKIDRPQKFSSLVPAMYGFIPQTYCKEEVAAYCMEKIGRKGIEGDGDPLDILVLCEREVPRGDMLVQAIPIGGFRMIDKGEADDKIISVLVNDAVYGHYRDVANLPNKVLRRLKHYFLTYKQIPGEEIQSEITHTYGQGEAWDVMRASIRDYQEHFGNLENELDRLAREWME